ncbi:MAG TPA: DUF1254 domain-containing protein [Urbifossiella sp.]|nr:DUF1254 domain-containing protein [Urbifossiella sp.]
MVNVFNRRLAVRELRIPVLLDGVVAVAPENRLAMSTEYATPAHRYVPCPNQDVIYGGGPLALELSPVVVQVPDFGGRFWMIQAVDLRTDAFADLGSMYGTKPGFYLLVGPTWAGDIPKGMTAMFRCPTSTGLVVPRVFQADTPADREAVQAAISGLDMYPLSEFDGRPTQRDWRALPRVPSRDGGKGEKRMVVPETFFDVLPKVLEDAPPLPGEEGRYAKLRAVLGAARTSPKLKAALADEAVRADKDLVDPLFEFRNWGVRLPHHWTTVRNGGAFGTDYLTRTAVARSNILVNRANETRYFYQDLAADGARLNGARRYTVTFARGHLPPVKGFWSLTLYDRTHFFAPNPLGRYSVGTKHAGLQPDADGSLTVYVQADHPGPGRAANWLPAPKGEDFSLYIRAYWPGESITQGRWTPPPVVRVE